MKIISKYIGRIAGVVFMFAFFSCFNSVLVHAVESTETVSSAAVVSSRTADDAVYIYIKGIGNITSGTTVQVGNTLCENIQTADVISTGMPIKTTILFDNSKSISNKWGSRAVELAESLIDNHTEGEEFRIASFADGLHVAADFSTDYESLKTAVNEIEFLDQESYLTDVLYDLLGQSAGNSDAGYSRFVVITDGADDNEIKYTQDELSELMKNSGVVIHMVGVKTSNNNELLEKLFSYARLTGGTYIIADSSTDVESARNLIDGDYTLLCLKLVLNAEIMDGSRKEAKFNLNTSEGAVTLTASLRMPFADVTSIEDAENAGPDESSALTAEQEEEKAELPSIVVEPQAENEIPETAESSIVWIMVIGAVVLVIIIVLIILTAVKRKKKMQIDVVIADNKQNGSGMQKDEGPAVSVQQNVPPVKAGGSTVRLGAQTDSGTVGRTMRLQNGNGQNAVKQSYISLTDLSDPQKSFRTAIDTKIVIGREEGDILLGYNAAVSYKHCEITKKGNLFYVKDLNSSNGTFYGGMRVHNEMPVMNGGILEMGTCKYRIMIEN